MRLGQPVISVLSAVLIAGSVSADDALDELFLHVLAHEMGHAAIREFDLPVTASEEAMADAFAVVALHAAFPDRAGRMVARRAAAHIGDGDEVDPFDEHPSDVRRAGAIMCLATALDPEGGPPLFEPFGLDEESASDCIDFGSEIARGWRRLTTPYLMPDWARVTEVGIAIADDLVPAGRPSDGAIEDARALLSSLDWHSRITLSVDHCDDGAGWARNGRRIWICDRYLAQLVEEAAIGTP